MIGTLKFDCSVSTTFCGTLVERGVDLGVAHAGNVDPEVPGKRHGEAVVAVGVEHHHRVGARRGVVGVLVAECLAVGCVVDELRLSDPMIRKFTPFGPDRRGGEGDARDLRDLVVDVAVHHHDTAGCDGHAQQDGESDAPEEGAERGSE